MEADPQRKATRIDHLADLSPLSVPAGACCSHRPKIQSDELSIAVAVSLACRQNHSRHRARRYDCWGASQNSDIGRLSGPQHAIGSLDWLGSLCPAKTHETPCHPATRESDPQTANGGGFPANSSSTCSRAKRHWLLTSLCSQFSSVKCEPKSVVRSCRNGDTAIINISQPMKLALGS